MQLCGQVIKNWRIARKNDFEYQMTLSTSLWPEILTERIYANS